MDISVPNPNIYSNYPASNDNLYCNVKNNPVHDALLF